MDDGRAIGIVAKDEYAKTSSKEALLTAILSDSISNTYAEQTHEIKFAGSFVEPSIKIEAAEEPIIDFGADLVETEIAAEDDSTFLSHQADSYRQAIESEAAVIRASFEKTATLAANNLVSYLQSLKYNGVRILSTDTSSDTHVVVTASLFDTVGEKIVLISLPIRDSQYTLPSKEDVKTLVSNTIDLRTKIAAEFEKDTLEEIAAIDELETYNEIVTEAALEDDKIVKTAAESGGMQFVGPVDVLQIDKHSLGMPDLDIGEKVYVDGFWWALTSKEHNNLSKEADSGSIWTLSKVSPDSEKKEPENKI
jgi:hypothetical protein